MVHVFYMDISGDCSYEQSLALYDFLPQERKEKIKKIKNNRTLKKSLYVGAFLQYVLSEQLGIAAEHICYMFGEHGKPELDYQKMRMREDYGRADAPQCYFNLSHSGKYAVLAVSDQPIGIDIEYKRKNYMAIAKRCFCTEEYEDVIIADSVEAQEKRFLEYWTMKEAFVKYTGSGLCVPLDSFCIIRKYGISSIKNLQVWFVTFFLEQEKYCVSICSSSRSDVEGLFQDSIGNNNIMTKISMDIIYTSIKSKILPQEAESQN